MNRAAPSAGQIGIALPFFLFGFLNLSAGCIWLAFDPGLLAGLFYRPEVIGYAHLFGLGFLMSLVSGSSYQLLPVAFEKPLFSRSLARVHLVLHVMGTPLMVAGFLTWRMPVVAAGATAVMLGFVLYLANLLITALPVSKANATTGGVLVCLASLALALAVATWIMATKLGLFPARDPLRLLGAHTYLMLVGFFLLLLVAVSYTLLPMFLLVPLANPRRTKLSVGCFAVAILLFIPGQFFVSFLLPLASLAATSGLLLYVFENAELIRRSPRRLDGGLRLYTANLFFVMPFILGLLVRSLQKSGVMIRFAPDLDMALFVTGAFGILVCAILGMGAKIVPFLIWQHQYAPLLGKASVPRLQELVRGRWLDVLAWSVPGAAVVLVLGVVLANGVLIRAGAGLLCVSMTGYVANLLHALDHLRKPRSRQYSQHNHILTTCQP